MPKISILPQEIRNKIAAGEVIERPASVIKELIENAYDAGASYIKVEFTKGGLERIAIYDNGEGMDPEDLRLCYLPHATSKLKSAEDLYRILSYGFRGEALASIAQVSRLKIISKARGQDLAHEIEVAFGEEKSFRPSHLREGTQVIVENLFQNLPARLAFLKSPKVESAKNLELLKALMITNPEKHFEVYAEGKKVLSWEGGSLDALIEYLYEIDKRHLREVYIETLPYKIHLLLSEITHTLSHGRFLHFLVNRRLIKDERLAKVFYSLLKKFYGSLGFPIGVVHIEVPVFLVDFNVHPAKWEVRFRKEGELYQALEKALTELHRKKRSLYLEDKGRPEIVPQVKEDLPIEYLSQPKDKPLRQAEPLHFQELKEEDFQILGVFKETYLLVEKGENLFIIDQHALSERLHFERLKEGLSPTHSQRLLLPMVIKLLPEMEEHLEEKLALLSASGFEIEAFGRDALILRAVPSELKEIAKEVVEEFLLLPLKPPQEAKMDLLKATSCRLARKKGDWLSPEERAYLVKKMFAMEIETCPHGRPIFIKLSLGDLEKKLKRRL